MAGGDTSRRRMRRAAWLATAMALFVAGYAVHDDLTYAALAERALALDARIVQVDRIEVERRRRLTRYVLHYEFEVAGKTWRFHDRDDRDRLSDLYTATVDGFTGEEPQLAAGKRFGVLVDPHDPSQHRPDRDRLAAPWLLWVRTALALAFLSAVAAGLFWASGSQGRSRANQRAGRRS